MIVGTAGHIDHGKTSLVHKLTGVDTDRLKEEKARGISIDLGFAYWPRPNGEIIGFVDVPGHEGLVHNMLAGAAGIDFVMLVIAADDGVMPQTREHLAIMDLLGLEHGIVALNKCDLVGADRLAAVTAEIEAVLAGTGLAGCGDHCPCLLLPAKGSTCWRRASTMPLTRPAARPSGWALPPGGRSLVHAGRPRYRGDRDCAVGLCAGRRSRDGQPIGARSARALDQCAGSAGAAGRGRTAMRPGAERSGHQQGGGAPRRRGARSDAARADHAHRCQPARIADRAEADRPVVPGQGASCRGRGAGPGGRAAR